MSDSSSSRSPYEQGEVTSSPEVYRSRTKRNVIITSSGSKDKQGSVSPQPKDIVITKQVIDRDVIEIASDEGEIERDSLNIKPPQSQAGPQQREKSHKHKHKREKAKDKQKQARDKDREREPSSLYSGYRNRNDRPELKDRGGRVVKDAREIVRERQKEKEKRLKESSQAESRNREPRNPEKEARKRKQSEKERERLENMEREKQRERRLREERERADKQRRKEEERRMQQRAEAEQRQREKVYGVYRTEKNDDRERGNDRNEKDRGRVSKDQKKQRNDRERSDIREPRDRSRKEEDEKFNRKGPQEQEEGSHEEDVHEVQCSDADEKRPAKREQMEEEEHEEPPSPKANVRSQQSDDEDDDLHKTPEPEESSSSDDDSDSESAKSSSSDTDADERKRPVKSKFENESEVEEVEEEEVEEEEEEEEDQHTKDKHEYEGEGHNDFVDDTPPQSPVERVDHLPVYLPAIMGCRSVEEFHCLNRIEEGTFGVVYRARDKKTNEIVALKRLKMEKEKEGFPITSLREINTLLKSQHVNIVTVREIVVGSNMDKIYIVMDYVEHDLKSLMETMKSPFLVGEVKTLMKQLCRAVAHLHDNWILHRDLKTSNLLLSHKGILKVGDFGLAREYGSPLKQYTPIVVTLWYRAPELLLGTKEYSKPVDMWSVGCIFAELLIMKALWPGKSEIDQLQKIFKDLGTPNEKIWEGVSELSGFKKCTFPQHPYNTLRNRFGSELSNLGFELLNRLLTYNPTLRMDASSSMDHQWYSESPLPVDPSMFPTWPARSEQIGRRHVSSPKPPSGGKAYAKLLDDDERLQAAGFHMDTAAKGASAQGVGFQLKF